MHPVLTVIVVLIIFNFLYHLGGSLFFWLKQACTTIFFWLFLRVAVMIERLLAKPNTGSPIKELQRRRPGIVRLWLHSSLSVLEKGGGGETAQKIWLYYTTTVPERYRHTLPPSSEIAYPLPFWMEQALRVLPWLITQFVALYMVILVASYLLTPQPASISFTQLVLYDKLEVMIEPCVWESKTAECFLHSYDHLSFDSLLKIASRELILTKHTLPNKTLDLLVDDLGKLYYPLDFIVPLSQASLYSSTLVDPNTGGLSSWITPSSETELDNKGETTKLRRYTAAANDIIPLLNHMHREETKSGSSGSPCVCSLFLNIVSNVSFLYDISEQRWLVMAHASLSRNNSFAELVASRISYRATSPFFNKYRHWVGKVADELIHYDSFVVEYIDPFMSPTATAEDTTRIRRSNDKLRDEGFESAGIFTRVDSSDIESRRKQVHVSGEDAICFVYCNSLIQRYTRN